MSQITTHVLDTALGKPARGVEIKLHRQLQDEWRQMGHGHTNDDGRLRDLLPERHELEAGVYRLMFHTGAYFVSTGREPAFFPVVEIIFEIEDTSAHYHVPLLLSPFGYSTYRGS